MPKPFGKRLPRKYPTPMLAQLAALVLLLCPFLYVLCAWAMVDFQPLAEEGLFWPPAVVLFFLFFLGARAWLNRRPTPHAPDARPGVRAFGRGVVAVVAAVPAALLAGFLLEPAMAAINGALVVTPPQVQYALLEKRKEGMYLASPYWRDGFALPVADPEHQKKEPGCLAVLYIRNGIFGVPFIHQLQFREFK
jgi:hypothetical protein